MMIAEKALQLAEDMSLESGRDCIEDEMVQVLAAEVRRLQLIISGKTQYDAVMAERQRCAEIARNSRRTVSLFPTVKECVAFNDGCYAVEAAIMEGENGRV